MIRLEFEWDHDDSPPKTKMSPKTWWLEDEISFWNVPDFRDMLILGGVIIATSLNKKPCEDVDQIICISNLKRWLSIAMLLCWRWKYQPFWGDSSYQRPNVSDRETSTVHSQEWLWLQDFSYVPEAPSAIGEVSSMIAWAHVVPLPAMASSWRTNWVWWFFSITVRWEHSNESKWST